MPRSAWATNMRHCHKNNQVVKALSQTPVLKGKTKKKLYNYDSTYPEEAN
jgi:hypothetical protein